MYRPGSMKRLAVDGGDCSDNDTLTGTEAEFMTT